MRILALALLTVGCSGVRPPSDLVPAPHPFLSPFTANRVRIGDPSLGTAQLTPVEPVEQPAPTYDPVTVVPTYSQQHGGLPVGRRLQDMEGERQLYGAPVNDLSLLKATFSGISGIAPVDSLRTLRSRTEARTDGSVRTGDLLFFSGDQHVPSVAVVNRVVDGAIEAAAVTRGAVRFIRVSPNDPTRRRRNGKVVNTFLRPKFRNDPKGTRYLAGQLLEEIRVLVR